LDGLAFEYTLLLTSQLESQRSYFEGMLSSLLTITGSEAPAAMRKEAAENVLLRHHGGGTGWCEGLSNDPREVTGLRGELAAARAAAASAEAKLAASEAEKRGATRRAALLSDRLEKAQVELEFHKSLVEAHSSDRSTWDARWAQAEAAREEAAKIEVSARTELEEQLRDVMMALDLQNRLGVEAAGGSISISSTNTSNPKTQRMATQRK